MTDYPRLVRDLVGSAMEQANLQLGGKRNEGAALAELLAGQKLSRHSGAAAIRAWRRGDSHPNADQLLAAAKLTGLRIDPFLYGPVEPSLLAALQTELAEVRQRLTIVESRNPSSQRLSIQGHSDPPGRMG